MKKFARSVYIFQTVSYFFAATGKYGQLLLTKLYLLVLKKYFPAKISQKRMELMTGIVMKLELMCFRLNYSKKKQLSWDHSRNFAHLFYIASKALECDKLHLSLLTDKIQADKKEYLQISKTDWYLSCLHRWTDTKKWLSVST